MASPSYCDGFAEHDAFDYGSNEHGAHNYGSAEHDAHDYDYGDDQDKGADDVAREAETKRS